MSFVQCSECETTVDAAKAYCPECGAAMDEEAKRTGVSEFDSLIKTQNINSTMQFRLMEQFKLSSVFKKPKASELETGKEIKAKPVSLNEQTENRTVQKKIDASTQHLKVENSVPVKKQVLSDDASNIKNKTLYIVLGVVSFLFILTIILVTLLIILYRNYLD